MIIWNDFLQYGRSKSNLKSLLVLLAISPGFRSVFLFRIQHWVFSNKMLIISHLISSFNLRHHGIHIVPGAKIGPGLRIEHPVGIVIGEKVVIGADCTIMQGTTMGVKYLRREKYVDQYPTIGDKVTVGANSVILGNVHIGNRSEIGAQSLVLNSAPDNSLIIGCPARNKHRDE